MFLPLLKPLMRFNENRLRPSLPARLEYCFCNILFSINNADTASGSSLFSTFTHMNIAIHAVVINKDRRFTPFKNTCPFLSIVSFFTSYGTRQKTPTARSKMSSAGNQSSDSSLLEIQKSFYLSSQLMKMFEWYVCWKG
mmetsp:Transcript_9308/g.18123  ORF Transcript_9308/g.18123 Transcript_9308/m.18123 type:complete len:139 (-) Transcript_9308:86-502(-)